MYSMIIRVVLKNSIAVIKKRKINVSINIAYEDIIDDDTLNLIYKTLRENPEEAKFIDFEILESELIDDYNAVKRFIKNIRRFGCKIGVDDFGSGTQTLV